MSEALQTILYFDVNKNALIEHSSMHRKIDGLPSRSVITSRGDAGKAAAASATH